MSDLALVLEVTDHLSLARQCPDEAAAVRSRVLSRGTDTYVSLVDVRRSVIYRRHQQLDEPVHLRPVVVHVTDLEGVVEEQMSCGS